MTQKRRYLDALVSKHRSPILFPPIREGNYLIVPSESVKNLGVIFDSTCLNSIIRLSFLSLRDMDKVCLCLPINATQTMVSSRLDYYNSLLFGLPKKQINKLQGIQNITARLVTDTSKYEDNTYTKRTGSQLTLGLLSKSSSSYLSAFKDSSLHISRIY